MALKKDPTGLITIGLVEIPCGVAMRYSDDGRGLNLNKIKAIGEARGLLDPQHKIKLEEIAELIFCSGLSTSSKINDVSGRGVAM